MRCRHPAHLGTLVVAIAALLSTLADAAPVWAPSAASPAQMTASAEVDALAAAVRDLVTPAGLEQQAAAIVQHERPSGSAGELAAIEHIVATLRSAGVPGRVHEYMAYASTPVSASLEVPGTDFAPPAITYSFSAAARGLEAAVVDVGALRELPPLQPGTGERVVLAGDVDGATRPGFPDVRGAIALVTGNPGNASVDRLELLGAVGVIYVNEDERLNDLIVTTTWGTPSLRNYHRLPKIPAVHIAASDGAALRALLARGPVRARLSAEVDTGWQPHRLAIATIPATAVESVDPLDPAAQAPFVLFGGHIDAWYHGGTDEGASNAAMVELAKAFWAQRERLRRGLVVAWWPGHSNARYGGSTWFADQYFDELRSRGVAYVNVDGIGQIDAERFGASASAGLAPLAARVVSARTGADINPGRPGRNSDQSFNGAGVPLLQINHSRPGALGGYWWWHTPDDTFDKIDFDVLKVDTDLYADALAALLAAPVLPVDLVNEADTLGRAIERLQSEAAGRFDLSEAQQKQAALRDQVERIAQRIASGGIAAADLELVAIIRPLHRVLYSPDGPFHPDSGLEGGALPGLAPIETLATAAPDTDAYRFAEVTLVRERNRLHEAIDLAIEQAARLLADTATPGAGASPAPSAASSGDPARPDDATPLQVMSFNIRYGTARDGDDAWQHRREAVVALIESFGAHVLGVQEALHFQLEELAAALPRYRRIGVGRDDGEQAGEYAAIMIDGNRLEVLEHGTFWFSDTPDLPGSTSWGNDIPRICTWARLRDRAAGATFYVYNVHWDHVSQPSRERSAGLLLEAIAGRDAADDPVLVTGDFNAGERNVAFVRLVESPATPLADTFRAVHADATDVGTFNGFEGTTTGDKIDAVLASPHWQVQAAAIVRTSFGSRYPSDHFPVVATVVRR